MGRKIVRVGLGLAGLLVCATLVGCAGSPPPGATPGSAVYAIPLAGAAEGFARADGSYSLTFPADCGPHPDYQTEWWYYTGNLETDEGRHFGYQLTFFRRALLPPGARTERASAWAAGQVYMAHFALTDVAGEEQRSFERFSRGAADLAGAQSSPYRVWLEDWLVEESEDGRVRLHAAQEGWAVDLLLVDRKGPTLHGEAGYSRKGPERGNASYYYSQTRLEAEGEVELEGETFAVQGWSWMDHEFSTSALSAEQVGWDWFSLQMDDGSELMVFQIRRVDGSVDPFSSGTWIPAGGTARHLDREAFSIAIEDTWRSPRSGGTYPSRWTIRVPAEGLVLEVEPHVADQELELSIVYWEGAVRVRGEIAGEVVAGQGYVEMTGYADSMRGRF